MTLQKQKKLHFINRLDYNNVGDWNCSPLSYYYDYFKQFNIIRHDIDFINYNEIEREDVVIFGGSGLFDVTESFNKAINQVLNLCDTVIGWSCGFNTHNGRWFQGSEFPKIDFSKFKLLGIRDYNHPSGIEYLPCPSSLAFDIFQGHSFKIKRKFGFIGHKDLLGDNFSFEDALTNNENINRIAEYILSSEAIVTNSYHCAYWTLLLGRKAIVLNKFSTKFDFYKYRPEFVEIDKDESSASIKNKFHEAYERANVYLNLFDEAKELNNKFFEKVKKIIEGAKVERNKDYENLYKLNCEQAWNRQIGISKVEEKIFELHEDIYANLDGLRKSNESLRNELNYLQEQMDRIYRHSIYGSLEKLWFKFKSKIQQMRDLFSKKEE